MVCFVYYSYIIIGIHLLLYLSIFMVLSRCFIRLLFFLIKVVVCCVLCVFFFFKQKTAYEMRISDWSSDVCSSDLNHMFASHPVDVCAWKVFEAPALGNRKGGDKMENNPADPWVMPPIREGHEAPPPILERRAQLRGLAALHPRDSAVAICEKDIGGVSCHVVGTEDAVATVLYFHGGGYRLGEPTVWLGFVSGLAGSGELRFILPDYRLAPEHPFPAALHDAATVYRSVLNCEGVTILAGDSAGGGLAAALTTLAHSNGVEGPDGLILLSPWIDLSATSPTYESNGRRDQMFSRDRKSTRLNSSQ